MMQGGRQPGEDHPITIEPADQRITVRIGGSIVAESTHALVLREASYPPVFYIPRDDILMDDLVATSTSTHCPYKGDASYFAARNAGDRDVAWSYTDPFDAMTAIRGHLAFYPDRVDAIEAAPQGG